MIRIPNNIGNHHHFAAIALHKYWQISNENARGRSHTIKRAEHSPINNWFETSPPPLVRYPSWSDSAVQSVHQPAARGASLVTAVDWLQRSAHQFAPLNSKLKLIAHARRPGRLFNFRASSLGSAAIRLRRSDGLWVPVRHDFKVIKVSRRRCRANAI